MSDLEDLRRRSGLAEAGPAGDAGLKALLDLVHGALRGIDAADQTSVIPPRELDAISKAVDAVEQFARARGIPLSEFQTRQGRMPPGWSA